jgi:hypothetical protein
MQVKKVYAYIHRNGYKTKLMAAAMRNKQDVFSLLGYILFWWFQVQVHETLVVNMGTDGFLNLGLITSLHL